MPELPPAGYLVKAGPNVDRVAWKEYRAWCTRRGVPCVTVNRAKYWKVECDAFTLPRRRFDEIDRVWLADTAGGYLEDAPSAHPRVKALPARMIVYGLTLERARQLAAAIVDRFPPLAEYRDPWHPYKSDTKVGQPAGTYRPQTDPKPPPTPRRSLLDRVRGGSASNVVDLATYRRHRRPHAVDVFGLPLPTRPGRRNVDPHDRGPA